MLLWAKDEGGVDEECARRPGTLVVANANPVRLKERWILVLPPRGVVKVDEGACEAVEKKRKSLFAAGVRECEGEFEQEEAVRIVCEGREIGRGLSNYSADELRKLAGHRSDSIADLLGYRGPEAVISRQNLCLWIPDLHAS